MANQSGTTIRIALTQLKSPGILALSSGVSNNDDWPEVENPLMPWDNFNLKNLNEAYGAVLDHGNNTGALNQCFTVSKVFNDLPDEAKDKGITQMIIRNDGMMRPTLHYARQLLQIDIGNQLYHQTRGPNNPRLRVPGNNLIPVDHIIAVDSSPRRILIVGLRKPCAAWKSSDLVGKEDKPPKKCTSPMRQLANICKQANTRYGYIMTEEEMVVFHFTAITDGKYTVAYKPIPWSQYGATMLTTDLALWWLCMMAGSDVNN
ncbi:hypothetical protein M434DRAFT_18661 [Hypoxylon sp. CO27-5]|nr:hypothetical protein M434DRAFT_18661 [Hypoxylon sp. CO27-5]